MVNPKAMEAWFTLMAEAAKQSGPAQDMLNVFMKASPYPNDLSQMMTRFMSPSGMLNQPDNMGEMVEEWCRLMGFVPRSRYLELLERYDILRRRLEEAEEKIRHLQMMVGVKGQEEEAKKMLDLWGATLEKTLHAQAEWLRTWTTPEDKQPQSSTTDKPSKDDSQTHHSET